MPARSRPTKYLPLLFAALLLAACARPPAPISTPTRLPASATPIPTQTIKLVPQLSHTPTKELPYGIQLTPLPPSQILEIVMNLFETNGGCNLPCWWGITPGQTTWEQAYKILEPLADRINFSSNSIQVNIPVGDAFDSPYVIQQYTVDENQVITMISAHPPEQFPFLVTDIVAQYGLPDEIVLEGWYPLADGVTSYSALYEKQGFRIGYYAKINVGDEILEVCPYKNNGELITSWDVESHSYLDWFRGIARAWENPDLMLNSNVFLSDVTSLSVGDFINLYQQPNRCFDTPGSIWLEFEYVK